MKILSFPLIASCLLLLLAGCATSSRNIASVTQSDRTADIIFTDAAADTYNFYYYGTRYRPLALLALEKQYRFSSEFWTPIEPASDIIKDIETNRYRMGMHAGNEFRGKEIRTAGGEQVGHVYSRYYWVTAWFSAGEPDRVIIPPPEPSLQQPQRSPQYRDDQH